MLIYQQRTIRVKKKTSLQRESEKLKRTLAGNVLLKINKPMKKKVKETLTENEGDNYFKFNPERVEEIKKAIDTFLKSKKRYDYQKILNKYSFKQMALKTLDLYNQALG